MISIRLDHEIFASCFMSLDIFQCLLVYSLWELEQNSYPAIYVLCPRLFQHHDLQPARLLYPGDSSGKNAEVGSHFLLRRIFPSQGLNPGLPHCRQILYHMNHQGIPDCINLNYVQVVRRAFWVYCILLLLCLFILLSFESLILKLQLKILIYPLRKHL